MRPLGRFFQVTEVNTYDKYLLDIDKVMHFPITFVIKTSTFKNAVLGELDKYIAARSGGMRIIEERYKTQLRKLLQLMN